MRIIRMVMLCLAFFCTKTMASNVGLGVTLTDNSTDIYLPITASENFKLSPFLKYYRFQQDVQGAVDNFKRRRVTLGVGLLRSYSVVDDTIFYFGVRLAYAEESESRIRDTTNNPFATSYDEKVRGYVFSPTIGFEYHISAPISVSAELEWNFKNLKGKFTGSDIETEDIRNKETETGSRVILTYYF